jgi:hypothetical protein
LWQFITAVRENQYIWYLLLLAIFSNSVKRLSYTKHLLQDIKVFFFIKWFILLRKME